MKGCFRNWWTLTTTCKILFLIQTLKYSKSLTSCCCTLFSCTWWKQARFNTHNRTMDFTGPNFTKVSTKATQRRQVNVIVSFYLINPVFFVFFFPNALLFMKQKHLYRGLLENSFTERLRKISWKTPLQESFLDNATLLENKCLPVHFTQKHTFKWTLWIF